MKKIDNKQLKSPKNEQAAFNKAFENETKGKKYHYEEDGTVTIIKDVNI